jgi:hypothetical protein
MTVEGDYLIKALKCFGFGDAFISWVKIIYKSPLASD